MEQNFKEYPTPSFNDVPDAAGNQEIRIGMQSLEESRRKLYEASKKGCIQTLKALIEEDPHLLQDVISSSDNESPLLHDSISHGHLEFTRLLLHHKPELAAEVDAFQRTPLHLASKHGDMETVRALLEKNTSACLVCDNNGLIPLHYAVISGQIEIMQELINKRPKSVWMMLNNGRTILHLCVESNYLEGIKLLIETFMNHDEGFLNTIDEKGNTILDLSIILRQSEMVGYLLSLPVVKIRLSSANCAASNTTKENLESQKKKTRNFKRERRESTSFTIGRWKVWRKKLKYKGDWVQEVQGTMMLVATVIATVTFQAGVNPPGGVWQQDTEYNSKNYIDEYYYMIATAYLKNGTILPAGTAIMAYQRPVPYLIYSMANVVSFMASVAVILLIISRVPLKNRICSWVLVLAMCAAVVFLAFTFLQGFLLVNLKPLDNLAAAFGYSLALYFLFGLVGLVGLFHIIRFLLWVVNNLIWSFTSKLKAPTTLSSPHLEDHVNSTH